MRIDNQPGRAFPPRLTFIISSNTYLTILGTLTYDYVDQYAYPTGNSR
ncbi:protein of unknown function [Pseudodesulfovibrio profundus]|uniref:Uncharacterized protein n=1 Tax=Pseudodesulfovibrio profundus TaxID=57320 RepID=A0A2C8FCG7_9BACT|nr:protein of unknown function [Pseudodesulfovibrio profundus]